ncbi:GNAT family N-acetyltransferase [Specibacter sp. RAF43]|uniref:GNAT family N-acetyltransferase n=1 Tax=Specibacter sp. RAF43 TaxID=3233057 RepID=UPI003F9DF3E8
MTDIRIEQLRVPDSLGSSASADFLRAVEVSRQVRIHTWGNDDLAYTAEEMLAACHDPYEWYAILVARLDGVIVGRAGMAMPLDDHTELAHVTLDILPEAQGHGLGRRLLEAAETFVRGENRKVVMVETNHAAATVDGAGVEHLPAANGVGGLPLDNREARFAYSAGYRLEQVEQFSSCPLPLDPAVAAALSGRARDAHGGAYAVHQWTDRCPEKWAADVVRLEEGDAATADGSWDVARLRQTEKLAQQTGRHTLVTAAEFLATGTLVGLTSISVLGHRDDVVFQDDTLVAPDHRGRELELQIKAANLELLAAQYPQSRTAYTWNAADNTELLDVNKSLGFVAAGVTGQWQKEFDAES